MKRMAVRVFPSPDGVVWVDDGFDIYSSGHVVHEAVGEPTFHPDTDRWIVGDWQFYLVPEESPELQTYLNWECFIAKPEWLTEDSLEDMVNRAGFTIKEQ